MIPIVIIHIYTILSIIITLYNVDLSMRTSQLECKMYTIDSYISVFQNCGHNIIILKLIFTLVV